MKRITAIFVLATLCLWLTACAAEKVPEQNPQENETVAADTVATIEKTQLPMESTADIEDETEKAVWDSTSLAGPWHLDIGKNDISSFADIFPEYGVCGASMEIQRNGQMSWYIGTAGGYGTYIVENALLSAALVSSGDQTDMPMEFRIFQEEDVPMLEMDYQGMTIYWAYGD